MIFLVGRTGRGEVGGLVLKLEFEGSGGYTVGGWESGDIRFCIRLRVSIYWGYIREFG